MRKENNGENACLEVEVGREGLKEGGREGMRGGGRGGEGERQVTLPGFKFSCRIFFFTLN